MSDSLPNSLIANIEELIKQIHVNYLKSPEGGRAKMGEFEKYFTEKGREEERKDTALEMLKDGEKLPKIIKYSKLTEADILSLAKQNGLEVVVA